MQINQFKRRKKIPLEREFLRNFFTLFSGATLAQLIPFGFFPLITRLYSPEALGLQAVFANITAVALVLSAGRYERAILLPARDKQAAAVAAVAMALNSAFAVLLYVAIATGGNLLLGLFDARGLAPWLGLLPLAVFFESTLKIATHWLNRLKAFRGMSGARLIKALGGSSAKAGGYFLFPNAGGLILGTLLGHILAAFFAARQGLKNSIALFRGIRKTDLKQQAWQYRNFPKYNMLHAWVNAVSNSLPILLLSREFGGEATGHFSAVRMLAFVPLQLITQSVYQVLSQRAISARNAGKPFAREIRNILALLFAGSIVPLVLLVVWAPQLFGLFLGEGWAMAGEYFRYIAPWLFMVFLTSPLSFLPLMFDKQRKALILEVIHLFLRAAGFYAGAWYGTAQTALLGFSLASFVMVSVMLVWFLQLARRYGTAGNSSSY